MLFDDNVTPNTLSSLMNSVPGGIMIFHALEDSRFSVYYFNDAVALLLGYSKNEFRTLIEKDPFVLVHPVDRERITRIITRLYFLPKKKSFKGNFRFCHKDGSIKWILFKINKEEKAGETAFTAILIDITREKEFSEKLLVWDELDQLTRIYNKKTFFKKTEELLHEYRDTNFTFILFDINNFKIINDMFGLEQGDIVLKNIAKTLKNSLHHVGTYGRLESDNFAACMPSSLFNVESIINEIRQCFIDLNIDSVISISLGIYEIEDPTLSADKISDRAQLALKSIKENLSQEFAFYDDKLHGFLMFEQKLSLEIQEALEKSEFELYLQPIYSISERKTVSAEALIRWNHPTRGLLPSDIFVPISEKKGFVTKLDTFIREEVCRYLNERQKKGKEIFPISVNLSRLNIYNNNFCEELAKTVKNYGLNPEYLRVEITESAYISDPDRLIQFIEKLNHFGFTVMMDDFGSEYSSLKMLKEVPVDILKIDKSFIKDIEFSSRGSSILSSVIRIARWLDIGVIAEGVESDNQLNFLRSMGCDFIQGFHFSKPLTTKAFDEFLEGNSNISLLQEASMPFNKYDLDFIWKSDEHANFMFNSMLTISGIYELYENSLEIVRVNDSYYKIFGTSPDLLSKTAKNALCNVHENDRALLLNTCKIAEKSHKVETTEIRRKNNISGKFLYVVVNIRHLCNLKDRAVFFFTFEDITEKQKHAIDNSFRKCLSIIKNTYDEAFKIDTINQTLTLLHLSEDTPETEPEVPLNRAIESYLASVHPEDKNSVISFFNETFLKKENTGEDNLTITYRIIKSDKYRWVTNTIYNFNYRFDRHIFISCIKNTDEKNELEKIKSELASCQKHLELTDEKVSILMEHSDVELWEYDGLSGNFSLVAKSNDRENKKILVHKDVLLNKKDSFSQESLLALKNMIRKLDNRESKVSATYSVKEKNGELLWKKAFYTSISDKEHESAKATGIVIDITQEENLRRLRNSEAHFKNHLVKNTIAFFECNLTTDEIITKEFLIERNISPDTTLEEIINKHFIPTLYPTDRKLIPLRKTSKETSSTSVEKEEMVYFEVRMRSIDGQFDGYRWRSVTIDYTTDPFTSQRHAFVYLRDIHKNKTEELLMREKASHDPLTGLLNRVAFEEQVAAALGTDRRLYVPGAFLIMDIDNFRNINNSLGHLKGDEVIRHAAKTLRSIFRSNDIIGRIGGDEMAVFMTNITNKAFSLKKGGMLCDAFKNWQNKENLQNIITCSVGIAMAPINNISFENLYDKADKALYLAKQKGKDCCCLYVDSEKLN